MKPNKELDYRNKKILAPMVRVGTLPLRLLALKYGADIVYGEEIIDKSIIATTRIENVALGSIDFVSKGGNGKVIYRTNEKDYPNVFQIGTNNSVTALLAAQKVCRDVVGIDINMGCPKHFSVSGGMGAALLCKPDVIKDILSTLIRNLDNPITCKIRLKNTVQETVDLMKMIEQTGVKAIAVHMRRTPERPRDPAHWDILKEVIQAGNFSVPIIANGDIYSYEDINKVKNETGCDSVMVARGACNNISIFQPDPVPIQDILKEYCKIAIETDNLFGNSKYTFLYMCKQCGKWLGNTEEGRNLHQSKDFKVICDHFDLGEYYENFQKELNERKLKYPPIFPPDFVQNINTPTIIDVNNNVSDVEQPKKKKRTDI